MAYKTTIPVRFGDVDRAGIVYYPVIFHYFHIAQEDFFDDYLGIPYNRLIEEERIGFPTVKTATEFYSPLKYGDLLKVTVHISRVGRSSLTFEFRVYRRGELLARSSEVKVCVRIDTLEKIDIPEKYRGLLEECRAD